jgi:hypothetical protein
MVVKVPLTEQATVAVLREAEVLESLAAAAFEPAPRLLCVDPEKGIATQTYVEGRSGARAMGAEVWRLLRSLMLPGETTSLSVHAQGWAQRLDESERKSCIRVLDDLRSDETVLPACWQHGDFAPWNIRRSRDGRCALIDWEDAGRNALPLQDVFHFLHVQDFLFGAKPTLHAQEIWPEASCMGISPMQCRKLEAAYLVAALAKCVRDEHFERRRFLLATLTQWQRQAA